MLGVTFIRVKLKEEPTETTEDEEEEGKKAKVSFFDRLIVYYEKLLLRGTPASAAFCHWNYCFVFLLPYPISQIAIYLFPWIVTGIWLPSI